MHFYLFLYRYKNEKYLMDRNYKDIYWFNLYNRYYKRSIGPYIMYFLALSELFGMCFMVMIKIMNLPWDWKVVIILLYNIEPN